MGREYIHNEEYFAFIVPIVLPKRVCLDEYRGGITISPHFSRRTRIYFCGVRDCWDLAGKVNEILYHKHPQALTCHLSNAVNPMIQTTPKHYNEPVLSLNTLMQYDQTLRAQHMLHSRQCTLQMDTKDPCTSCS